MAHEFVSSALTSGAHVITFTGKTFASIEQALELKSHCQKMLEAELKKLVINLENLSFISSVVIGQIFLLKRQCDAKGIAVGLACPNGPLRNALCTVGVDRMLPIDTSVDEAIRRAADPAAGTNENTNAAATDVLISEAEAGLATAQFELACRYETGDGVNAQDPELALALYLKAANSEHPEAQFRVAQAYAFGIATMQDYDRAIQWYRRAAANGNTNAKRALEVADGMDAEGLQ